MPIHEEALSASESPDLGQRGVPRPQPHPNVFVHSFGINRITGLLAWTSRLQRLDGVHTQQDAFIRSVILLV